MPALSYYQTFVGGGVGRWLGRNYCPGVEVTPPVTQSFGYPRIGLYNDLIDGRACGTTNGGSTIVRGGLMPNGERYNYCGVDIHPDEGGLPRQLFFTVVVAGAPQTVQIRITGRSGWGYDISEVVEFDTVTTPPALNMPPNTYPYNPNPGPDTPPGYDNTITPDVSKTVYTYCAVRSVEIISGLVTGAALLYLGRVNAFGLKYPIIPAPQSAGDFQTTDEAAFVLGEWYGDVRTLSGGMLRTNVSPGVPGAVSGGRSITGDSTYVTGLYVPYTPLVNGATGGDRTFMLTYIPSRIDSHDAVYPHMFKEEGQGSGEIWNYQEKKNELEP